MEDLRKCYIKKLKYFEPVKRYGVENIKECLFTFSKPPHWGWMSDEKVLLEFDSFQEAYEAVKGMQCTLDIDGYTYNLYISVDTTTIRPSFEFEFRNSDSTGFYFIPEGEVIAKATFNAFIRYLTELYNKNFWLHELENDEWFLENLPGVRVLGVNPRYIDGDEIIEFKYEDKWYFEYGINSFEMDVLYNDNRYCIFYHEEEMSRCEVIQQSNEDEDDYYDSITFEADDPLWQVMQDPTAPDELCTLIDTYITQARK